LNDFDSSPTQDTSRSTDVAHTVQDKASEGAGLVGEKSTDVARTAKEQAGNAANEVSAQARDLAGQLREQLQDQSRAQAEKLATNVRRLADELHDMSDNGKPDSTAAAVVRQVADSGRQAAAHLENRGPEGIVEDLRDFARRKPGLFLAGAAVAGFAAARIGKGVTAAGTTTPGQKDATTGMSRDAHSTGTLPRSAPQTPAIPAVPAPVYSETRSPESVRRPEEG
jgi:hypothetical protein